MSPEKYEFIGFSLLCETCWERGGCPIQPRESPRWAQSAFPTVPLAFVQLWAGGQVLSVKTESLPSQIFRG